MKRNEAVFSQDFSGKAPEIDYFSLAFQEFGELFELFLYGPGERTRGKSGTPEKAHRAFSENLRGKKLLVPRQVHGKEILLPSGKNSPEGDGIFLEDSSWRGMLRFADCCPVILFSSEPHPWMLLLHMGFRGVLEDIPSVGWRLIRKRFPSLPPERCRAFLGPAVRGCCYSRKMEDPFTLQGMQLFPEGLWELRKDMCFFDLPRMGAHLLAREGMKNEHMLLLEECVCCGPSKWYSYRRGDEEDRNVLLGGIRRCAVPGERK